MEYMGIHVRTGSPKIKALPRAANIGSEIGSTYVTYCLILFRLNVPPMEKKLDIDSNEKESGEYRGVVYTINGNP